MAEMRLADLPYALKDNILEDSEDFVAFLGYCIAHGKVSKSQNFQDIWALYENDFMTDGLYVEFGATDGITGSNTYILQTEYGWRGVLAEPNPVWHKSLYYNRHGSSGPPAKIVEKAVWTDSGKDLTFITPTEADLGTIQGYGTNDEHAEKGDGSQTIKVQSIELAFMLMDNFSWYLNVQDPIDINYMSVDTEGSEWDILRAYFDDERSKHFNIKCITVEHNYNPSLRKDIRALMEANGYVNKFPEISRWDDFYKKVN